VRLPLLPACRRRHAGVAGRSAFQLPPSFAIFRRYSGAVSAAASRQERKPLFGVIKRPPFFDVESWLPLPFARWCAGDANVERVPWLGKMDVLYAIGHNVDREKLNALWMQTKSALGKVEVLLKNLKNGEPIPMLAENMEFFNSLQARWAERYVLANAPGLRNREEASGGCPACHEGASDQSRLTLVTPAVFGISSDAI
jgi:hypothetical protein